MKVRKWHDSCAVVAFVKFNSDIITNNDITVKSGYRIIFIYWWLQGLFMAQVGVIVKSKPSFISVKLLEFVRIVPRYCVLYLVLLSFLVVSDLPVRVPVKSYFGILFSCISKSPFSCVFVVICWHLKSLWYFSKLRSGYVHTNIA